MEGLFGWVVSTATQLLCIGLVLAILAAAFSPFESLRWWAGWDDEWEGPATPPIPDDAPTVTRAEPDVYLVYLSGVGAMDPDLYVEKEINFLDQLQERLPTAALARDVFPYSVTNTPLTKRRWTAAFWVWWRGLIKRLGITPLNVVTTARNLMQVAISADERYGPIYNFGIAREIVESLGRQGYRLGSRTPVVVMGLSGGGQIAVGATPSLKRIIKAPVWIISIGGVLTSDPGILAVEKVYQLSGSKDPIQYAGRVLFPGCWSVFPRSDWNRALRQGKLVTVPLGPMKHMGHGDYMSRSAQLPTGQPFLDRTLDAIIDILADIQTQAGAR